MTRIRKFATEDVSPERKKEFDESLEVARRFELFLMGYRGKADDLEKEWQTNADAYLPKMPEKEKEKTVDEMIAENKRLYDELDKVLAKLETEKGEGVRAGLTVGRWDSESKEWKTSKLKLAEDKDNTTGLTVGRWNPKTKKWEG